jgi:hypothetical protein
MRSPSLTSYAYAESAGTGSKIGIDSRLNRLFFSKKSLKKYPAAPSENVATTLVAFLISPPREVYSRTNRKSQYSAPSIIVCVRSSLIRGLKPFVKGPSRLHDRQ